MLFKSDVLEYEIGFDSKDNLYVDVNKLKGANDYDLINLWIHYYSKVLSNFKVSERDFKVMKYIVYLLSIYAKDDLRKIDEFLLKTDSYYTEKNINNSIKLTGKLMKNKKTIGYSISSNFPVGTNRKHMVVSIFALVKFVYNNIAEENRELLRGTIIEMYEMYNQFESCPSLDYILNAIPFNVYRDSYQYYN